MTVLSVGVCLLLVVAVVRPASPVVELLVEMITDEDTADDDDDTESYDDCC